MLSSGPTFAFSVWARLLRLRGVGQIAVGVADNSVIPMPGSLDVLTIWLAASQRRYWWFYALMATFGALIGGYITYELARKGGKEALERKLRKRQAQKLVGRFKRWGFGTVAVPAMLPPPFPIVPFLLAAGALQYPRKRFFAALALGRGARFTVIAGLGAIYGDPIVGFFSKYYKPALEILIGLAVIAGVFGLIGYLRYKKDAHSTATHAGHPQAA